MTGKTLAAAMIALFACLALLKITGGLLVDWLWFSAVEYPSVFWTIIRAKVGLFFGVFLASMLFLGTNASLAQRLSAQTGSVGKAVSPWESLGEIEYEPPTPWLQHFRRGRFSVGVAIALAVLIALTEVPNWDLVLRFIQQVPFGQSDPLYAKDIGFYFFSFPAYLEIKNWMLLALTASALLATAIYAAHGYVFTFDARRRQIFIAHGSALLGVFFAVEAWSFWLERYQLLYRDNAVVVGAAYTDVHVTLPALTLLAGIALVAALILLANLWTRSYKLAGAAALMVVGGSLALTHAFPALFQRFYVKPNELQLEAPYLQRNITLTQQAYNLNQVTAKPFPAEQGLNFQSLENNRPTVDNIRLWDWRPLADSYAQLQEIRTYYKFHDIDVDRYDIAGSYQQVMLSARELEPTLLPVNAQTWVNLHLLFTHGNGVVMSPVTRKSAEGLPIFYLKDIPPVASDGAPVIREPRIYFGQASESYVIVKTSTPEFDYPKGKDNVYGVYDGADGISIGGIASKLLFAWRFGDIDILLSRYLTDESRILIRRRIQDRVRTIAPFLLLDQDPYLVIHEGRLYWMQDAYTTSSWFPYAQPMSVAGGINYLRNSVKTVVDAYNGTVDFYVADSRDPVIATYQRIFPALFKPLETMPRELQRHVRYPEDLFRIQADIYRAYHMDAPEVFYNREDLWQFPRQPTGFDQVDGGDSRMAPYYVIMRLPGETQAQFFLLAPMAPSKRENMIAWLAARCDAPDYGKLIVYEFPKDKLVYGPFQIEARINQNTEISQQISLWNQMGSRVIRGNLLVVPIENSILYVSPLYLRAEAGQLPELKRVIAAYGDRLVMKDTLAEALAALFEEGTPQAQAAGAPAAPALQRGAEDRAREALRSYERAMGRLKAGDWGGFGADLDAMRKILEQMGRRPNER